MVSGEKRNSEEERMVEKVTTVLLDIEGTTTSISFVKDKLFPYVREQLQSYVDSHWENDEFKKDLQALKDQAKKDEEDKVEGLISIEDGEKEKESLIKNITWQMDLDRKTTALKQLQGHIWREGYENGKLKGHIYDDVASCLKKWSEDGRRLFVYSSGSVEAQKLLFKNTEEGDLLEFLAGYYDTTVGPKTESSSYESIAKSIGCDSEQILFLTDVVKEAQAAKSAGFQTLIVVREGNAELSEDDKKEFVTISSFKEIVFESSAKKKKVSNGEESIEEPEKVEKEKPEKPAEEKMESEPEEKKTEPAPEEKKDVNGEEPKEAEEEKMEVDVVVEDEVKPAETISEDCKKTAEPTEIKTDEKIVANNETEESNKTESEKVAVDVVETKEEEKKEEEKKEVEKEAAPAEDNEKKIVEEEKAKEEEVKVTKEEPAKEIEKPEETKEEAKPEVTKEETKPEEEKKPEAEEKKEEVKEAEKKEEEPKVERENNKEESENHKVETEDKKEEKEEKKEEAESKKEVTENNKDETENKTEEKKEMNGKTNGQENGEKNGVPETEEITVKKVLPEETPDTAVEVKA